MKKLPIISASILLGALTISSCSTNKMAMNGANDNLYFMASDVKIATQYAVENNNPKTFQSLENSNSLIEENFSARNVNPEYISRYQATSENARSEVVYFDEGGPEQQVQGNINAYDNFYSVNGNQNRNSPNINFNLGFGFGSMFSPWGMGFYDPFWGPRWGWRPGFNLSFGLGWGNPWMGMGWGNPWMMGWGAPGFGWGYPMYGWGYPAFGWGHPIYAGRPIYVLPGGEYGGRRVAYGARPTRGAGITNSGLRANQAGIVSNTARAQARRAANTADTSPRRISANENSRVASRNFGTSQNDYYNTGRSRTATVRNVNSPVADRAVNSTRSSIPSARPSATYDRGVNSRSATYPAGRYVTSPSRSSSPTYNRSTSPSYDRSGRPSYNRSTSPSYNRSTSPSYNRSTRPSYNRSTSPSFNRSSSPSRSSVGGFSSPSRSSGGSSFSAPSRSSGGSVGGSSGGSRGGRGN